MLSVSSFVLGGGEFNGTVVNSAEVISAATGELIVLIGSFLFDSGLLVSE